MARGGARVGVSQSEAEEGFVLYTRAHVLCLLYNFFKNIYPKSLKGINYFGTLLLILYINININLYYCILIGNVWFLPYKYFQQGQGIVKICYMIFIRVIIKSLSICR